MLNGDWILMLKIKDTGFVLSLKRHSENAFILTVLTKNNGKFCGLLRGKKAPLIGSFVSVSWQARLAEHLGTFAYEDILPLSSFYMEDKKRLACLSCLAALLNALLPEREAIPDFYRNLELFTQTLSDDDWLKNYIFLELELLKVIGFGLDFRSCAGGGDKNDLAYVSPKTGRAVSREKGLPYHDKLLPLPAFLWKETSATTADFKQALSLIGFFLAQHTKELPIMREKML